MEFNRSMQKRQILYPAGLISLIVLPLLCVWYLYGQKSFNKQGAIGIHWWDKELGEYTLRTHNFRIHPERNYIEIQITGAENEDREQLAFAEQAIRKFVAAPDTVTGIHFHFNDNSKYWALIRALDICFSEGVHIFIPYENDIWVYNVESKPEVIEDKPQHHMGTCLVYKDEVIEKTEEQVAFEKSEQLNYKIGIVKTFWPSILLFICMMVLTVIKLRKTFNNRSLKTTK